MLRNNDDNDNCRLVDFDVLSSESFESYSHDGGDDHDDVTDQESCFPKPQTALLPCRNMKQKKIKETKPPEPQI